jgi:predicted acetyltransferase
MSIQVRTCATVEEFKQAAGAIAEYGAWTIDDTAAERFLRVNPVERMHGAFEGGRVVGGAGAFLFDLTVPGGTVACAGVTIVGVYPTHRRRGVLTSMMQAQLRDVHERGEPVAALWASDERIYGRYGYGLGSLVGSIELPREHAAYASPLEGRMTIRYVEPRDVAETFAPVFDQVRAETPGMFARSQAWWEARIAADPEEWRPSGAGPKRFVVAETAGAVEGYAVYRHAPKWDDGRELGTVRVSEVMAVSLQATAELWRYLFDVEWVQSASAWLLPVDHPLFFLLAQPRRMRFRVADGLWIRIVDVRDALSARSYAADGTVVFDIADAFCPWNEGRWKLEEGEAKRTRAAADLRCDVAALGSVYLGGFTFAELVRGGRVEELRPGAARRADAMVAADRAPWCPEIF